MSAAHAAAPSEPADHRGAEALSVRPESAEAPFAAHTDVALTELAAQWDTLDVQQRRALLTEMRQRMALRGARTDGTIKIRTERRYGRIIQQPDGRVIRIETQVVHVRPISEEELAGVRGGFGVGFERRTSEPPVRMASDTPVDSSRSGAGEPDRAPAPQLPR